MDSPKVALGKYVAIWKLTVKSGANLAGKCHIYPLIYNQPHVNWYANVALPFLLQIYYHVFTWSLRQFCH